jgi:quinol monooxygenase YgiN
MNSNPDQPIVRIAELEIDAAQLEHYKRCLTEEIQASMTLEPGVLSLNAVTVKDSATSIRIVEIYASEAAYQSHLLSPHFLKYKMATTKMVKSLRLIETVPLLLCSKQK